MSCGLVLIDHNRKGRKKKKEEGGKRKNDDRKWYNRLDCIKMNEGMGLEGVGREERLSRKSNKAYYPAPN